MSEKNPKVHVAMHRPAEWLNDALASARDLAEFSKPGIVAEGSPAFRRRCRDSALAALALARLREERQRVGFVPLPLADYIEGIARSAGVSLDALLARLGVPDLSRLDAKSAGGLGRLAHSIGIGLREALLHLRIQLAAAFETPEAALFTARARSGPGRRGIAPSAYDAVLERIEAGYDAAQAQQLREVEAAMRAVYTEPEGSVPP